MSANPVTRRYLDHAGPSAHAGRCAESELLRAAFGTEYLTRPAFLDHGEAESAGTDLRTLFDLLVSLPDRLYDGDVRAFARAAGWAPIQVETVFGTRSSARAVPRLARGDLYREESGFRLLELNTGSALGGFDLAELNRVLLADEELDRFVRRESLGYPDTMRALVDTLLGFCPGIEPSAGPVLALVDWPSSFKSLAGRLGFMAELLRPWGFDAIPCHAGELEIRSGGVFVHGRRIDVIHRWFVVEDLLDGPEDADLAASILDAAERGLVSLFAPLEAELYGSKGCMAILSDDRHRAEFDTHELAFLDRFLPWTRTLWETRTELDGERVDLVPEVLARREDLILKPTTSHGGIGIVAGWATGPREWAAKIAEATGGGYIVQRRIRPVSELFPRSDTDGELVPTLLNWGVFLTESGYGGAMLRGTTDLDAGVVSMADGARFGTAFHR